MITLEKTNSKLLAKKFHVERYKIINVEKMPLNKVFKMNIWWLNYNRENKKIEMIEVKGLNLKL